MTRNQQSQYKKINDDERGEEEEDNNKRKMGRWGMGWIYTVKEYFWFSELEVIEKKKKVFTFLKST